MPTLISWASEVWNPTTGCSKVSSGCLRCYAEAMSLKFGWSKKPWTARNARENVILHEDRLNKPYRWGEPKRIFVNSMSDLFHEYVPDDYIAKVFKVMNECHWHVFQILTKRADRAAKWKGPWSDNIWLGVSVENATWLKRIDTLRQSGAGIKFVSYEPALGPLGKANLRGIQWLICGGESGPGYRPMRMEWALEARDLCVKQNVAFFFKQDSGFRTELRPYLVDEKGRRWQWHQYPGHREKPSRV